MDNALVDKTISFAVRIVKCCQFLRDEQREMIMSKQLLRCGTSIGANVHECLQAQSRADFVSKLGIALKEASETSYWLTILHKTDYLSDVVYQSLKCDTDEIIRIIISSIKTAKKNLEYENK